MRQIANKAKFSQALRGEMHRLLVLVDETGFKLGRASIHYLERTSKKATYLLVTAIYAPEINGIFDIVAASNCNSEIKVFATYLFQVLITAGIFWGLVEDKRYDAAWITAWCEAYGIVTFIPARGDGLQPFDGSRLEADLRYKWLMRQKYFRALIESSFSFMKSFFDSVKSRGRQDGGD